MSAPAGPAKHPRRILTMCRALPFTAAILCLDGTAGIGLLLLHLDAVNNNRQPTIVFPDTPFDWRRSTQCLGSARPL